MISLFHIPHTTIDTAKFKNLLHDKIVQEFEHQFAEYVGAKYAVALNSATSAIFLTFYDDFEEVAIPSILPPVVANALIRANNDIRFEDNVDWVGGSYILHEFADCRIIDSAHRVAANQFAKEANSNDLMIFSFYPTKPISSCDGGMVVSNNKDAIDKLRIMAYNGMLPAATSWEQEVEVPGFKMYMNSIQAFIAMQNLRTLDYKKELLANVRRQYNHAFGLKNTSDHLYRITVNDNRAFIKKAAQENIVCGIHYRALHQMAVYWDYGGPRGAVQHDTNCPQSEAVAKTTISIPFHEKLTTSDINKVIEFVKRNQQL
jgi:dTDP-4-amino-4,6-dideoxygalactose transaminase